MRLGTTGRHVICALAVITVCATTARAGTITAFGSIILPGASTGTFGPVGATPSPNNDNAGAVNANTVAASVFYNALGSIDVEFVVANSGGATEYGVTQSLVNNSGSTLTDYRFELGFGVGASFVPSGPLDALDFDTPDQDPAPTSTAFAVLDHQPDALVWTGGTVPSIGTVAFSLAIDVPDNLSAFHPQGLSKFTLRQLPTTIAVPEPPTVLLLSAALGALALSRRTR